MGRQVPAIGNQKLVYSARRKDLEGSTVTRGRRGMSNIMIMGVVAVVVLVVVGISLVVLTSGPTGSGGFTTTLGCPTTATTERLAQIFDLGPLFGNFSAMSGYVYQARGQSSGTQDANYSVTQTTATAFKVSVASNATGTSTLTTAWVLRNGTVTSASQAGYNFTGAQAERLLLQSMNPLLLEVTQSTLTPNPSEVGATVTNQSAVTIGSTEVSVSTYASNGLPVTLTQCTTTQTVTKFVFQTGTAQGATFPLLTEFDVDAYQMVNGQPLPIDVVFMLTSVVVG